MIVRARVLLRLLPWLAAVWLCPAAAQSQVNRCMTPGGQLVFTDKSCAAIGASDRVPRDAAAPVRSSGSAYRGCARNLQALMYEIAAAIDHRDVNRLGGVYHWIGVGREGGERVLDRLQAIVDRPLVDIVPIRTRVAIEPVSSPVAAEGDARNDGASLAASGASSAPAATTGVPSSADPASDPASSPTVSPRARSLPTGLRLEQTLRNGSTPSRTYLGLRRHLDCWWITF